MGHIRKTIWRDAEGNSHVNCKCATVVPRVNFFNLFTFKLAKNLFVVKHLHANMHSWYRNRIVESKVHFLPFLKYVLYKPKALWFNSTSNDYIRFQSVSWKIQFYPVYKPKKKNSGETKGLAKWNKKTID